MTPAYSGTRVRLSTNLWHSQLTTGEVSDEITTYVYVDGSCTSEEAVWSIRLQEGAEGPSIQWAKIGRLVSAFTGRASRAQGWCLSQVTGILLGY